MTEPVPNSVPAPAVPATTPGYRGRPTRRNRGNVVQSTEIPQHYGYAFIAGIILLIAYFFLANPNRSDGFTRLLAGMVLSLSCLPMILFLFRGKIYQVPALESHGMFYAMSFGFAGFLPVPSVGGVGTIYEPDMDWALVFTFLGLSSLFFGYYFVGVKLFKNVRPNTDGLTISVGKMELIAWLCCFFSISLTFLMRYATLDAFKQVRIFSFSLGFFLLLVLALEKKISFGSRLAFFLFLLPYEILLNSGLNTGQLAGTVCLICWISLVMLRCWRHIPVYLLVAGFLFFIVFQPVKFYVRTMVEQSGGELTTAEMLEAYGRGFFEVYGSSHDMLASSKDNFDSSFERVNHLALFAAIIRDTPSSQPYLYGETYVPLLTKWIPRALWKGKPMETLGNSWAVKYGFLSDEDYTTSFNLPWLPEMYMNGGWVGVLLVMFILGIIYRYMWQRLMGRTTTVMSYAVGIVFAQSLVFAESNLSMQLGGIIIFAIFLWAIAKILGFLGFFAAAPRRTRQMRSRLAAANT